MLFGSSLILCVNDVENISTKNSIKVTSSLELKLSFPTFISEQVYDKVKWKNFKTFDELFS